MASAVQAQQDQCDAYACGGCDLLAQLMTIVQNPETLPQIIAGIDPADTSSINITILAQQIPMKETADPVVVATVVGKLLAWIDECLNVPTPDPDATTEVNSTTAEPIDIAQLLGGFVQAKIVQEAGQEALKTVVAPGPTVVAVDLTLSPVGSALPETDLNFLVDGNNKADLEFALRSQLAMEAFFKDVSKVSEIASFRSSNIGAEHWHDCVTACKNRLLSLRFL